jgi:hypothetical protein
MIKRTLGLSILGLLVISGLAGRLTNDSLTKPERKKALTLMKESRSELLEQLTDLKPAQRKFRIGEKKKSIQDLVGHISGTEEKLWSLLEEAMRMPSSQVSRSGVEINDEELLRLAEDRTEAGKAYDPFLAIPKKNKSWPKMLNEFKTIRTRHIRYLRTSTEDLRNHVVTVSFGTIDCYQLCLLIAAHTNRHLAEIRDMMKDPSFPK